MVSTLSLASRRLACSESFEKRCKVDPFPANDSEHSGPILCRCSVPSSLVCAAFVSPELPAPDGSGLEEDFRIRLLLSDALLGILWPKMRRECFGTTTSLLAMNQAFWVFHYGLLSQNARNLDQQRQHVYPSQAHMGIEYMSCCNSCNRELKPVESWRICPRPSAKQSRLPASWCHGLSPIPTCFNLLPKQFAGHVHAFSASFSLACSMSSSIPAWLLSLGCATNLPFMVLVCTPLDVPRDWIAMACLTNAPAKRGQARDMLANGATSSCWTTETEPIEQYLLGGRPKAPHPAKRHPIPM